MKILISFLKYNIKNLYAAKTSGSSGHALTFLNKYAHAMDWALIFGGILVQIR